MNHVAADDNDPMDLVDKNDNIIGTINQVDAYSLLETKAGLVRGTAAFIQNDKGKLWIPYRTADKRIAPNGLDFSVAEHVQRGETYKEAVIRGFKEELFLEIVDDNLKFLGKLDPIPELPYFFISIYLYKANEVKEYNHADYKSFEWLYPQEVVDLIINGTPSKNALKVAIEEFILKN
jgi:isopentenyldiphosphate isomerase